MKKVEIVRPDQFREKKLLPKTSIDGGFGIKNALDQFKIILIDGEVGSIFRAGKHGIVIFQVKPAEAADKIANIVCNSCWFEAKYPINSYPHEVLPAFLIAGFLIILQEIQIV